MTLTLLGKPRVIDRLEKALLLIQARAELNKE
jgi:hypothetical protein